MKVSWQVTGIRNDAYARSHRIEVEIPKENEEKGKYLFPREHDMPESLKMNYEEHQTLLERINSDKAFHEKLRARIESSPVQQKSNE